MRFIMPRIEPGITAINDFDLPDVDRYNTLTVHNHAIYYNKINFDIVYLQKMRKDKFQ